MRKIQLTITLTRCQSDTTAVEIADQAAEHLHETFNDDNSLGEIWYTVLPSVPTPKRATKKRSRS